MERHHEVALHQALDQVYLEGAACIRWDYLYLWFQAERFNKGSYREIQKRWEDLCTITYRHEESPELTLLNGKYTLTILRGAFDGETLAPLTDWT